MTGYCKNCHQSHSAWTRLNDGVICGLCGARERNLQVVPVNASIESRKSLRASKAFNRDHRHTF